MDSSTTNPHAEVRLALAQMRLYEVLHARMLFGDGKLLASWRERAEAYPPSLTRAMLRLNKIYLPNPHFKHVAELIEEMTIMPPDLLGRLKSAYRLPPAEGVLALHGVIADVFDLVDRHVPGFDTGPYRERMRGRRPAWQLPLTPGPSPIRVAGDA
jgi:hypothetical protein